MAMRSTPGVAAQMVDVRVRVDDEDRRVGQRTDHALQISDAAARIDGRGALLAEEEARDRLLEVPGLVDRERFEVIS